MQTKNIYEYFRHIFLLNNHSKSIFLLTFLTIILCAISPVHLHAGSLMTATKSTISTTQIYPVKSSSSLVAIDKTDPPKLEPIETEQALEDVGDVEIPNLTPLNLLPIYTVRLQAIAAANTDGSDASPISANVVAGWINELNEIFRSAGIQFVFDPQADYLFVENTLLNKTFTLKDGLTEYTDPDVKPPIDSTLHGLYRTAYANAFRGKLTLIMSRPDELEFNKNKGHWDLKLKGSGGSSSGRSRIVSITGDSSARTVAHEIGHYLHLPHTFLHSSSESVEEAANRIKVAVENGLPIDNGLFALDGDSGWVTDTPEDTEDHVWKEVYGGKCMEDPDYVPIPVDFGTSSETYDLRPNRSLIMGYYYGCNFERPFHFSPQQAQRMRTALQSLNRHDLISLETSSNMSLLKKGSVEMGNVDTVELVRVDNNRVVSVTTVNGQLKLRPWKINTTGDEIVAISAEVSDEFVGKVVAHHVGLNMFVTAIQDSNKNLRLISWRLNSDGSIDRLHDVAGEEVREITITRWDTRQIATAVITKNQNLRVIAWRVDAFGNIARIDHGEVGYVQSIGLSPGRGGVRTVMRDGGNKIRMISWEIKDGNVILKNVNVGEYIYPKIHSTALDFDSLFTSTVLTESKQEKVIAWHETVYGSINQGGSALGPGFNCSNLDSVRLGVGILLTACETYPTHELSLSIYEISAWGNTVKLHSVVREDDIFGAALARVHNDIVVSAVKTGNGSLKLTTWQLQQ